MAERHSNCIVFLTHVWSPPVARHFERLKREASPYADVFLAYQASGPLPPDVVPDIVVTAEKMSRLLPRRYAQCEERALGLYNYVDLVFLTAFNDPVVSGYEYCWYVEMDVDYSGDWGTFFKEAVHYDGDLLAQSVVTRSMLPDFDHWYWYEQPADVTVEPLRALMCIARFSRPMIDILVEEHNTRSWDGIFELTHPTIAADHGMQIAQIGGSGPFTPPERRKMHYSPRTFTFRPPRAYSYFVDAPQRFKHPNKLYHPVKVGWPLARRVREIWFSALRRWENHSVALAWIIRTLRLRETTRSGMPSRKKDSPRAS